MPRAGFWRRRSRDYGVARLECAAANYFGGTACHSGELSSADAALSRVGFSAQVFLGNDFLSGSTGQHFGRGLELSTRAKSSAQILVVAAGKFRSGHYV